MHSRDKGRAGSKRPPRKTTPSWLRYKANEIELLIAKLAKEGYTPSRIGLFLRDTYGIPDVKSVTKNKITKILKAKKLVSDIPEDLTALMKRSIALKKHMEKNNHDMTAKRGIQLTEAKINRLIKYYKKAKKLPQEYKYDAEKAGLRV